ncbi:MAG: bifunctional oligoribonuclease/PAP phosphatase NrnA [Planctomycetaceae bacterium]
MTIQWEPILPILAAHQRFVISSHVRPDADAIGSEIGLARLLQALGKSVQIINFSATPPNLFFLDPNREVKQLGEAGTAEAIAAAEVHFVVDTSSWMQLNDVGKAMRQSSAQRVVIDHHLSADDLGATEFKDTQCEATGSLIFDLAQFMGIALPPDAATALYAAIATDTGWFRFSAVTSQTMIRIAGLMEFGASPAVIYRELYERSTLARMHLVGRALARMVLDCDGELAYISIPWSDFEETGAVSSDTEDLVNECLKITGTRGAFIAIELQNRQVKVSFRSRAEELDVSKICEHFGGGGHRQAAGTTMPGPLADSIEKARTAMSNALANIRKAATAPSP